jgi:centromeric protein E
LQVLGPECTNDRVHSTLVQEVVEKIPQGINGTVFAYGVTSSGKTFTMHGTPGDPGVVARSLSQLFEYITSDTARDYLLRLSYVEIYNEVVNDLLDPARQNLRVVEDPLRGQIVEGAREELLMSSQQALALVAQGEEHRKVGATAYNQRSSRSHTFVRVTVESNPSLRGSYSAGGDAGITSRLSMLNLIDLAGSEAAKVQQSRTQTREGGYINKSLLALGTVIAKLGDQSAVHIPYRDSKLTRLLQSSLSGTGASMCIICTVTPAAAQAEETHNTLKFASRAKLVRIKVHQQERYSAQELLLRYQREVHDLRQQLAHKQGALPQQPSLYGAPYDERSLGNRAQDSSGADMAALEEVLSLREQLEEERAVRLMYERSKCELQQRVERLTKLLLDYPNNSSRSTVDERSRVGGVVSSVEREPKANGSSDAAPLLLQQPVSSKESMSNGARKLSEAEGESNSSSRSDLHDNYIDVIVEMREQMLLLKGELGERDRQLCGLKHHGQDILRNASEMRQEAEQQQDGGSFVDGDSSASEPLEKDIALQVLHADRDVLEQQLQAVMEDNARLKQQLATRQQSVPAGALDSDSVQRLAAMEAQVQDVLGELAMKEEQLEMERKTLERFQALQQEVSPLSLPPSPCVMCVCVCVCVCVFHMALSYAQLLTSLVLTLLFRWRLGCGRRQRKTTRCSQS